MSDIKVLALDLDGTLTNDQKLVTPRTRAALDAAIEKGVTVVLASGRPTAGIQPLAEELGLDKKGGCILSYNGGKIVDCTTGETLVETTLDPATRILKRVEIEDGRMASDVTEMLMGTEVPPRKAFIYEHAQDAELDV